MHCESLSARSVYGCQSTDRHSACMRASVSHWESGQNLFSAGKEEWDNGVLSVRLRSAILVLSCCSNEMSAFCWLDGNFAADLFAFPPWLARSKCCDRETAPQWCIRTDRPDQSRMIFSTAGLIVLLIGDLLRSVTCKCVRLGCGLREWKPRPEHGAAHADLCANRSQSSAD